jgi:hypothetical protein
MEHDDLRDILDFRIDTGESRLWAAVLLSAVKDGRISFFESPGSNFLLACHSCGLNPDFVREAVWQHISLT